MLIDSQKIALFEDLLFQQPASETARNIDEVQELIVVHGIEVYGMIPKLYTSLQILKLFFMEIERLERQVPKVE